MLFNKTETTPVEETFDNEAASRLHQILKTNRKLIRGWRLSSWAVEIKRLRLEIDDGKKRITRALDWYQKNCNARGSPKIRSGASFRKLFEWLEQCVDKEQGPQVRVSEEAMKIVTKLQGVQWPKSSGSMLAASVQISLERITELREKLYRILHIQEKRLSTPEKPGIISGDALSRMNFTKEVLSNIGGPSDFVYRWHMTIWHKVINWKEWSGDLDYFTFSLDHQTFQREGEGWSITRSGRPNRWTDLMEAINEG